MIKIVVDSTADIPPELRAKHDITVVPVLMQFGTETLRDDVDITRDEFYARLVNSTDPPKTAAPAIGMFEETFRALAADGSEVLSISLAGDLSSTFTAAQQAARLVDGARIVCVDSRAVAMPLTYLAVAAAKAARAGQSIEEIVALIEPMRPRTTIFAGAGDAALSGEGRADRAGAGAARHHAERQAHPRGARRAGQPRRAGAHLEACAAAPGRADAAARGLRGAERAVYDRPRGAQSSWPISARRRG